MHWSVQHQQTNAFWFVRLYKTNSKVLTKICSHDIINNAESNPDSAVIRYILIDTFYRRLAANTKTKVRLVITYIYGRQGHYTLLRFVSVCNCRPFCFAWLCCEVTVETSKYRAIFAPLPTQSGKQPRATLTPRTGDLWAFVSKIQDLKHLSLSP